MTDLDHLPGVFFKSSTSQAADGLGPDSALPLTNPSPGLDTFHAPSQDATAGTNTALIRSATASHPPGQDTKETGTKHGSAALPSPRGQHDCQPSPCFSTVSSFSSSSTATYDHIIHDLSSEDQSAGTVVEQKPGGDHEIQNDGFSPNRTQLLPMRLQLILSDSRRSI